LLALAVQQQLAHGLTPLASGSPNNKENRPMPVISVSRWQITQDEARRIVRDAASQIRQAGAQSVTLGRITTGQNADQTVVAVTYENFETMGRAMQALQNNQQYQQRLNEARQKGQLLDRTVIEVEEITQS